MLKRILKWVTLTSLIGFLFFASLNVQNILDWWRLTTYTAPGPIADLAQRASLSSTGEKYFYLYTPSIETRADFQLKCDVPGLHEESKVVGCFDGLDIYILDIEDGVLEDGEVVTAAHEMLHAAYDRLSDGKRKEVNDLLAIEVDLITDQAVLDTLADYEETSPESFSNEAHSVIGTEVSGLNPELEEYFSQYFLNRETVVNISSAYNKVFLEIEEKTEILREDLNELAITLNIEGSSLDALFAELDQERRYLQSQISAGFNNPSLVNQVAIFDVKVDSYNVAVQNYRNDLKVYDDKFEEFQGLTLKYEELKNVLEGYEIPQEIVE